MPANVFSARCHFIHDDCPGFLIILELLGLVPYLSLLINPSSPRLVQEHTQATENNERAADSATFSALSVSSCPYKARVDHTNDVIVVVCIYYPVLKTFP